MIDSDTPDKYETENWISSYDLRVLSGLIKEEWMPCVILEVFLAGWSSHHEFCIQDMANVSSVCSYWHVINDEHVWYVRLGYCFTPYQRLRLYNGAPFSRLLRHAGDTEDVFSA